MSIEQIIKETNLKGKRITNLVLGDLFLLEKGAGKNVEAQAAAIALALNHQNHLLDRDESVADKGDREESTED